MKKDPTIYIDDMLEAIALIEQYLTDTNEKEFSRDSEKQDAVIHRLMIIGEAAQRVSSDVRAKQPDIPWRKIVDFRNVIIHEYSGVSLGRVWRILADDVPILKNQLLMLRKKIST